MESRPFDNPDEKLYTQLNPKNADERGRPSSMAFLPSKNHERKLSVDREGLTSPEDATRRFTARGLKTLGAWAVTVSECSEEVNGVADVPVLSDPGPKNPAHCLLDFSGSSNRVRRRAAKYLGAAASRRGCLYRWKSDDNRE